MHVTKAPERYVVNIYGMSEDLAHAVMYALTADALDVTVRGEAATLARKLREVLGLRSAAPTQRAQLSAGGGDAATG